MGRGRVWFLKKFPEDSGGVKILERIAFREGTGEIFSRPVMPPVLDQPDRYSGFIGTVLP